MAGELIVTIIGNLTADPDLRFLPSGAAVCSFTVASTPRVKKGDDWVDGEPMFVRCNAWRQIGENAAESLVRGTRVIVYGRMTNRSWEKEGVRRNGLELEVDALGAELRHATVKVNKAARGSERQRQTAPVEPPPDDPWAKPAPGGAAVQIDDEPPF